MKNLNFDFKSESVVEGEQSVLENMWYYDGLLSPQSKGKGIDIASSSLGDKKREEDIVVANIFRVIDEDGDGRVSAFEIVNFVEKLGLSMTSLNEVKSLVRAVSNCEYAESLNLKEFTEFYHALFDQSHYQTDDENDEALREAFRMFDENGDGVISAAELGNVLCKLGYEEHGRDEMRCRNMISRADLNGDGHIDIHEFKHLLCGPILAL